MILHLLCNNSCRPRANIDLGRTFLQNLKHVSGTTCTCNATVSFQNGHITIFRSIETFHANGEKDHTEPSASHRAPGKGPEALWLGGYSPRVCLKIHSHHLHAPLCRKFSPHSVNVAHYASLIRI